MTRRHLGRERLRNMGSLITYLDETGTEACLGDLLHFEGRGVYEPNWGRVDVTREEAEAHNTALDAALVKGLDEQCQLGQGGYAYLAEGRVTTFLGTLLSDDVTVAGRAIAFRRSGRIYRGRLGRERSFFRFRRIA